MKYVWERPFKDTTHYPLIYSVFESDKASENKTNQVFRIEDIQEDRFSDVIEFMKKHYLVEDPMLSSKNIAEDEESLMEIVEYWKTILDQKISIACFKEDSNEIIGLNLLSVITEDEYDFKPNGEVWSEMRKVSRFIKDIFFNPFEHYSVDTILTSGGCYINENYQRCGIEYQLIKAKSDVGKLFDVRISMDTFSTAPWQDASLENEYEEKFSTSFKKLPKLVAEGYFPGIQAENLKVFSKKFY